MIEIYPDPESLSQAAAELFVALAVRAGEAGRRFSVALSGGRTPCATYELLGRLPFRELVPWPKVHIFWGDDRCIPQEDPRSNEGRARRIWLDRVPVPADQIHPIGCGLKPRAAADRYEAILRAFFGGREPRFDLVFLGLGENGHTLSLFPGTPVLDERDRWAVEVYVAEEDIYRISLTTPIVNRASLVVFLVAGAAKAKILRRVLEGPRDPHVIPAQLIEPAQGELRWMVDHEAAALLKERPRRSRV